MGGTEMWRTTCKLPAASGGVLSYFPTKLGHSHYQCAASDIHWA